MSKRRVRVPDGVGGYYYEDADAYEKRGPFSGGPGGLTIMTVIGFVIWLVSNWGG